MVCLFEETQDEEQLKAFGTYEGSKSECEDGVYVTLDGTLCTCRCTGVRVHICQFDI